MSFSELEKSIIRELQGSLPMHTLTPFSEVAARCGIEEDQLLRILAEWKKTGALRRVGAVLKHRNVGKTFNAMSVWAINDPAKTAEVACELSAYKEITHCYERPTRPNWPYNLFGMMHCESQDECERIARQVAEKTGVTEYRLLLSTREYKKESLRYF